MNVIRSWGLKATICKAIAETTGEDVQDYDDIKFKELDSDLRIDSFAVSEFCMLLEEELDCELEIGYINPSMTVEQVFELLKIVTPSYLEL